MMSLCYPPHHSVSPFPDTCWIQVVYPFLCTHTFLSYTPFNLNQFYQNDELSPNFELAGPSDQEKARGILRSGPLLPCHRDGHPS